MIINIKKRDGRLVPFSSEKIRTAISKAASITGELIDLDFMTQRVVENLQTSLSYNRTYFALAGNIPSIEDIQDSVETELILNEFPKTAKHYILYRDERNRVRREKKEVPEHIVDLVSKSKKYFRTPLSEFVFYRTYSNWLEEEKRRETWEETVSRYIKYMWKNLGSVLPKQDYIDIEEAILKQEVMPSMRLLQFAGKAADSTNVCAFNCSYQAINSLKAFSELMYLLMCGTGVGFSVESSYINQLPPIKKQKNGVKQLILVPDSKEGWCTSFLVAIETWFNGGDVDFDFSSIRPNGTRLKTMGGRASGPEPLKALLNYTREKILSKQKSRLSSLDAHDICCMTGECVVVGGVRRSALISLSDLSDAQMREAKLGAFYITESQRRLANNSAVYEEKPEATVFMKEWLSLATSGTGERGIFNRAGLKEQLPQRRIHFLGENIENLGTNPCGEILLQPNQFCNLSEVICRSSDTEQTLLEKVRLATIIGTYQSMLTDFPFLSSEWKKNCEDERLLGVSLTGQWDCPTSRVHKTLYLLRKQAVTINEQYARLFRINKSTAITCIKPSGTTSQLVDSASGGHPRHAPFYIRRVRIATNDPLFKMLKDQKVPYYPEVGQDPQLASIAVIEFPMKSPQGAICKNDLTAIGQLEHWKVVKTYYTEHNPSVTISVGEDEWIKVANWIYENWNIVGGLSFLPREKHVYKLAPYEEITEEQYNEMVEQMPKIDYSQLVNYEKEDETDMKSEPACSGPMCEIQL